MRSRKAACEPCRKSKLACDHRQPVCTRCSHQNKAQSCVYRATPFKRRPQAIGSARTTSADLPPQQIVPDQSAVNPGECSHDHPPVGSVSSQPRHTYPNPGYLGQSSHESIFNQLLSEQEEGPGSIDIQSYPTPTHISTSPLDQSPLLEKCIQSLKQLVDAFRLSEMETLVTFWRAKGASLALAEPFVDSCANFANYSKHFSFEGEDWHHKMGQKLLENTQSPLKYDENLDLLSFCAQFLGGRTRWETLGIFLCAAFRATLDVPFFLPLYTTESEKRAVRKLIMQQITYSLDLCLSLDCLNDLQLVFQYENVIVHSFMDGDQSFFYWRQLGDVISSALALGYHENANNRRNTPQYLVDLRNTAYQRIYSADKNISLFLGRPLRMSKRFCFFHLPDSRSFTPDPSHSTKSHTVPHAWKQTTDIGYRAEARWSAVCATIKEDIIELIFKPDRPITSERASELQATADAEWNSLPPRFRAYDSIKQNDTSPFERDFLISFRLNYLHIFFLLQRLLSSRSAEPNAELFDVSQQILELIVEAVLWRDELVNSGTTLGWKIVYYGLPAAGIVLLGLRNKRRAPSCAKIMQNLSVLAAELKRGTIVKAEDPNYSLLSKATQVIQRFLHSPSGDERWNRVDSMLSNTENVIEDSMWFPQFGLEQWDSEILFWDSLASYSLLNS